MLQLKEIVKSYTTGEFTQVALNKVSLKFRKSEFVAILGPSGSGKTTCLNIIGGLDQYDQGDLIINGKSTKNFKDSDWDAYRNNSVGFVFQSYNLISHLSIMDNVEMGMTLSGVSSQEKHKKAIEVLEKVGLKEHIHKKPNQLSGGQMQRVAIARALANDPDIILADEPTGALDTHTSVQIMELIKEISKDKLVVMVTHNPELANEYTDRIVEFRDGEIKSDSNPFKDNLDVSDYKLKKTNMSFLTALKLSAKNISTKKWRTALTAFASSIGIIGIALVLSLSNGFDKQIGEFENSTLSGFPITISQKMANMDVDAMREQNKNLVNKSVSKDQYPNVDHIFPYDPSENSLEHTNNFTKEYLKYVKDIDSDLLSGTSYTRLVNMNLLKSDGETVTPVNTSTVNFSTFPSGKGSDSTGYLKSNYNLLSGSFPKDKTDLVLIVDSYNRLDKSMLKTLGIDESKNIKYQDIVGKEFKIILNNDFYDKNGNLFISKVNSDNLIDLYNDDDAITVKISGIVRSSEDSKLEILSPGLYYSDELSEYFIEDAKNSDVVKAQKDSDFNVLTGQAFGDDTSSNISGPSNSPSMMSMGGVNVNSQAPTKDQVLSQLGANSTPNSITIYPKDFTTKDDVLTYLNKWNDGKDVEDSILYTDLASTFTDLSGGIMDSITLVLIAFASISLIVSLIMIGIITYISVLERTKEIGVLRSLGARKKDVTRVFTAETFIIGTCSGLLGILISYLLTFPINNVLKNLTDLDGVAQLNPVHAILLVIISVGLTLLGGALPARMAAKKNPVEALRTE
ncbi:ATP-binding cassette domain-containing protein [Clostridioides mangenotii]|uniref:ABC transporter ATP-binding protein/permease n=1 Tax=Metaclostridioides mangenotii TaxID=1540 RepID=UPI00214A5CA1|nr:ABC transporter ATP-binding protein/permease [Clostridioides mangenotii]MCR1955649.1 ATP-binding cassette domain-containing protein [Clostridioides mangenotii]